MFETALVESAGKLKSKSRYWMFATLAFNLLIVTVLTLVPLLYPEALPRTALTATLIAPPPPPAAPPPSASAGRASSEDGRTTELDGRAAEDPDHD